MPLRTLVDRWNALRRPSGLTRTSHRRPAVRPLALEPLEGRRALTVAAPTIRLMADSDTGFKGDGITRIALPAFAGFAPRGAFVAVSTPGDNLLGVARANFKGVWSLKTPVAHRFATGEHVVSATTVDAAGNPTSGPTPLWIKVDPTPPVALLTYDVINKAATLSFSKPVIGVKLSSLRLVGMTTEGVAINVPLNDPGLASYIGGVALQRSPEAETYTFRHGIVLAEPGTFRLILIAKGSGITDRAGNPLSAGVSTRFQIV